MEILKLRAPDLAPTLAALHARSFGDEAWTENVLRGSLALDTTDLWIAREEGAVQGFLVLQIVADEAEILTFCVDPTFRRNGIAANLLTSALQTLPNTSIFLEVAADNLAAITLYEKHGFTLMGRRPAYYARGEARIDALTYRKNVR